MPEKIGNLIASVLSGAWRRQPPHLDVTGGQMEHISEMLLGSRAGALGWWKVRHSDLRDSAAGRKLEGAYQVYAIERVVHEQTLQKIFKVLRSANIEPILYKGWAASHFYPDAALRPYLDFDLIVPNHQFQVVTELISGSGVRNFDLEHYELTRFDSRKYDDLFERSCLITLGEMQIRVPCPEDHLRLLCIHLLKHGGSGPLWLSDVAAAVEGRSDDFDWDRLLGNSNRQAKWIAYTVELARRILGARTEDTPVFSSGNRMPSWIERSVIKDWSTPRRIMHIHDPLMAESIKSGDFLKALRLRWPNPIEATVTYNGSFNRLTTPAHQFRHAATQAVKFASKFK